MRTLLTRVLAAFIVAAFSAGPIGAAAATKAATIVAQDATTATVTGIVRDDGGAPLAGAHVELRGPQTYTATTDSKGGFTISGVAAGVYVLAASKPGYQSASESDFALIAGQSQTVQIGLHAQTFSSLRTIATVRSSGRAQFNTSPAAVNVISAQSFVDQAQPQVNRILNQIPGVQNTLPTSSANGAVDGAITVPNVRGGLSFETASLIDGHPLAVGDYGDYVSTFLNSFMLGSVEVIKGPGAMSPETNYAIGGTVNFRTKDPTLAPTPDYTFGVTSHGGSYYNLGISDTIGRLGFVLDLAGIDDPTALNGTQEYFQVYGNNSVADWNGSSGITTSYNQSYGSSYLPGTQSKLNNVYNLLACCYTYQGNYDNTSELFKLRYRFSNATTATVSYLGGQTFADQNANTSELIPSTFEPNNAGYTGSLAAGSAVNVPNAVYPNTAQEINNEPIFQAEVRSLVGQDTVLARFYHASIDRLIYEGNPNPAIPVVGYYNLYGTNPPSSSSCAATTCPATVFNGQLTPVAFFDWYNQFEEDRLNGLSFEYDHSYGIGNDMTFSIDQTNASSVAGSQSASFPGVVSGTNTFAPASSPTQPASITNPSGTTQLFTTFLLRNVYNFTPKLSGTLALYDNQYQNTFPYSCIATSGALVSCGSSSSHNVCVAGFGATPAPCPNAVPLNLSGSDAAFTTTKSSHFDERLALEFRPSKNLAIRASAGSSIAPPYLSLLSKTNGTISYSSGAGYASYGLNNPNLLPETAFGYDLGFDLRLPQSTVLSVDGYLTNLYNHFLTEIVASGTCTSATYYRCPAGGAPLIGTYNTNLANSRYEGLEVALKRIVPQGFGFDFSGALQHAYAYDLPANFYCAGLPAGTPCVPATYNTNLPIIAGENFTGNTFGTLYNLNGTNTAGGSGLSNTAIPYFQGDFSVNYTTKSGIYGEIGETVYGKNNGYNLPPFGIGYATIRVPVTKTFSVQASGDNIFNAWTRLFPIVGGGIAYPLANGGAGATIGNTVGPATYRFQITKTLGADPSAYH